MEGILIAVEGVDGAGKTTQVNLLGDALSAAGEEVVISKEPTNGHWGQVIRESARTGRLSLPEEIEAFNRDRMEHVETVIQPALDAGKIVILDRYFYSFVAYQGARGADPDKLWESSEFAPVPDVVFLLDIDPRDSLLRIRKSRGQIPNEFEKESELNAVRELFLQIFATLPNGVQIDGMRSVEEVQRALAHTLIEGVLKKKRCAKAYGCDDAAFCIPRLAGTCRWVILRSIKPVARDDAAIVKTN